MSNSSTDPVNNQIIIGHVARAHGLKGDVAVVFYTDHPGQFTVGFELDGSAGPLTIERVRSTPAGMIVKFVEVADRDEAERMKGVELSMPDSALRVLEVGEYWPSQLVGLEVRDRTGARRGVVAAVVTGAAQDRLVVDVPGGKVEVPFVDPLVPIVDVDGGFVVIEAVPGLLEIAD